MLDVRSFHESFYGTPKPAETGRRGKKRQPKAKEEPEYEIAVIGVHYRSFDDDSMAAFVNSPAAQVPWNGDKNLLIDRYDVRHLLQDLSGIRRRRRPPSPSPDVSQEELDYERYRDLEGLENPSPAPDDDASKYESDAGGLYQRVGFNYSSGGNQSAQGETADRSTEETAFDPPFSVPEHLLSKLVGLRVQAFLPSSVKVHQIMAGTAKFVIEHGGQAEIVLRVKQASNPTFGFLMPDHYNHEYFRFLVDNPQLVGVGPSAEPVAAVEEIGEEAEGGLSLLGTAYGDSDEEDEADVTTEPKRDHGEVGDLKEVDKGDNVSEERSGGSEHGSHGRKSPTSHQRTAVGSQNGTCDSGDSRYAAGAVEVPGSETQDSIGTGGGEAPESGAGETVAGLPEPLPPGTETSDLMDVEYKESSVPPEYAQHDLPPYKEPPMQLRRIIEKMVEFISRNGKEFEAVVRERDKKDGRFQFLLPWNEFYPFFSRSLEDARQAIASAEPSASDAPPTDESKAHESKASSRDQTVNDHFLKGVPYWDESSVPDMSTHTDEAGVHEIGENIAEASHKEVGGMGFEAVMAAVRAATRGVSRAVEETELAPSQPKSPERVETPPIGSDDAVIAAIRVATGAARRSKAEEPSAGGKGELLQSRVFTSINGATDQTLHVVECIQEEEKKLSGAEASVSNLEISLGSHGEAVVTGKAVAKAAALAAGQEGDSADALLSPAGKRKAERLKRAKLFAAMLREGNGAMVQSGQASGSHGVSATPSVEKSGEAGLNIEVNLKENVPDKVNTVLEATKSARDTCAEGAPSVREQTSDALVVQVDAVDDIQHIGEVGKDQKPKAKLREADEKQKKHHRKRKSHHDVDDRRREGKYDSDAEQRKDRRHDHHYEEKRKDRRRDRDDDVKVRDKILHASREEVDEDTFEYDYQKRRDSRDSRKDRRYQHDTDSKKSSRQRNENGEIWHEGRHGHDVDGNDRMSRHRRRHGSDDGRVESTHQKSDEKKKDVENDHESEEKRKERRHGEGSEERREYRHASDEKTKDRRHSHGKRKKHKDVHGRERSEDDGDEKHSHRKSRRHRREAETHSIFPSSGKPTMHGGDTPDYIMHGDAGTGERHGVTELLQIDRPTVSIVKDEPSKPVDVPDDIRAKVRAMLARI